MLGVLLLGMVAATLAGTTGALQRQANRDRQRLAAAELANRLLLQYVDDENNLPSQLLPVAYDGMLFRWRSDVRGVGVELSGAGRNQRIEGEAAGFDFRRRLTVITVSVWLAPESGGSAVDDGRVPRAQLTRMIDPIAFNNADSLDRRFSDDPSGLMEILIGISTGAGTGGSSGSSGNSGGGSGEGDQ
ncbi:MAG: hypothetical protein AAF297_10200 [Planctomycetota bacterium]